MKSWLMGSIAASLVIMVSGCGGDDDNGNGGPDAGGTGIPEITRVTWTTPSGCQTNMNSNYTISITATDSNTSTDMLTYSGTVTGCTPQDLANMATQVIVCPNQAPYSGSVTVRDPENNMDSQNFIITPCTSGQAP